MSAQISEMHEDFQRVKEMDEDWKKICTKKGLTALQTALKCGKFSMYLFIKQNKNNPKLWELFLTLHETAWMHMSSQVNINQVVQTISCRLILKITMKT